MNEPKEKINPADTAKKILELTSKYEADKSSLENIIKEKDSHIVDLSEINRQRGNKISALEKELEEVRIENKTYQQIQTEKKENKMKTTFAFLSLSWRES